MREHEALPSQWLTAADVPESGTVVTIAGVSLADVGRNKETKPILNTREFDKGVVLNKTNWRNLVNITKEEDSDGWFGKQVELYATKVEFQGEAVDAIRIRQVRTQPE